MTDVVETGEIIAEGSFNSKKACISVFGVALATLVFGAFAAATEKMAACIVLCSLAFVFSGFGMLLSIRDSKVKLEVTKQCIYRRSLWGRHTYLPLNSIRAVDMMWFGSISVRTAVGKFDCHMLSNRNEVFLAIKKLLDDSQKTE